MGKQNIKTKISGAELHGDWHEVKPLFEHECLDKYQPDATFCGGLTVAQAAAPVAGDDLFITPINTGKTLHILSNDTDADSDALSIGTVDSTSLEGGTVVNNGDGTVTYTPSTDFMGLDTFSYTVSDGGASDSGQVSISVNATFDVAAARSQILNGVNFFFFKIRLPTLNANPGRNIIQC